MDSTLLQAAKDSLNNLACYDDYDELNYSLSNYGLLDYNGKCLEEWRGEACYTELNHTSTTENVALFYDYPRTSQKIMYPATEKDAKNLMHWIANDSPWQEMFETRDAEEMFYMGFILNSRANAKLTISAAMAIRSISEFPRTTYYWNLFKDHICPEAAYVFAHAAWPTDDAVMFENVWGSNHTAFMSKGFGQEALHNFMQHKIPTKDEPETFRFDQNFEGVSYIWEKRERGAYLDLEHLGTIPLCKLSTELPKLLEFNCKDFR